MANSKGEIRACILRLEDDISLLESKKRQGRASFKRFRAACLIGGGFVAGCIIGFGGDYRSFARTTRLLKAVAS